MYHTDNYSQHSGIIWPVRLYGWVIVFDISGVVFDSCFSCLNFRFGARFGQAVLEIQATIECEFSVKIVRDINIKHNQMHCTG